MWLSYLFGYISYNVISIIFLYLIKNKKKLDKTQIDLLSAFCCISFCIIAILGTAVTNDYYPNKENVELILSTKNPFSSFEPFWVWIISKYQLTYNLYLLCLQGVSFTLFYWIVKLVKPRDIILFWGSWFILLFFGFIGGRIILFSMLFYMAVALRIRNYNILALIFLILCSFTHKTAYIAIPVFFMSLIQLNKKRIIILCVISLLGPLLIRSLVLSNVTLLYNYISEAGIPGAIYLTYEDNANVTGNIIWGVLPIFRRIILYYLICKLLWKGFQNLSTTSKAFLILYRLLFWFVLIATSLFLIDLPDPAIASRIFGFSIFCMILLICEKPTILMKTNKARLNYILLLLCCFVMSNISTLRVLFINHIV